MTRKRNTGARCAKTNRKSATGTEVAEAADGAVTEADGEAEADVVAEGAAEEDGEASARAVGETMGRHLPSNRRTIERQFSG